TDEELGKTGVSTPRYSGRVVIYDKPGFEQQPTGKYLYSGDLVNIISQASTGTGTWYEINDNEWINGNYVNFDVSDSDVA
ncbi:GW dipeptide domain-containing protein, partial [Enterococcus faecalis]|uniref:GW dipeptide domain-containing protein n=1 Tax=Enterococcus faecalis TaxID=1351 RepID=UPI00254EE7BE